MASLARTLLEDHLERGELVPGQEIALRVDQTLAQDATGTMAMMQLELFGVERVQVETAVVQPMIALRTSFVSSSSSSARVSSEATTTTRGPRRRRT